MSKSKVQIKPDVKKIILYTAILITAKAVIPAKAGIQTPSLRRQGTIIRNMDSPVSSTGQA